MKSSLASTERMRDARISRRDAAKASILEERFLGLPLGLVNNPSQLERKSPADNGPSIEGSSIVISEQL